MKEISNTFLSSISDMLHNAQNTVKTAVNLAMVYSYYEVGRMIFEEEQKGSDRAEYGKYIIKELSEYLTAEFGKGYSKENLKLMRRFYVVYSNDQIEETLFTQFNNLPQVSSGRRFYLSWSHYLKLMRIDNIDERHFYEIESIRNDWSLTELKRQFDSSLYERLALSTDKDSIKRLAAKGQIIEAPTDMIKDPYVLEFLGLEELPTYSENELETRIIDNLEKFLSDINEKRALVLDADDEDDNSGVTTLTPTMDITALREHYEQLKRDIIDSGQGVIKDLDKFGNAPSGVALKFMYSGLNLKADAMVMHVTFAFEDLLYFIDSFLDAKHTEEISITFNLDMKINETEKINNLNASSANISQNTYLTNHPYVDDVEKEKELMESEGHSFQDRVPLGAEDGEE